MSAPISLAEAQKIAESILGPVDWRDAEGWCRCPGGASHTTRTTATDCKVVCMPVTLPDGRILPPGVYCFHGSCEGDVEAASFAFRSALGRRCAGKTRFTPRHPVIPKPKPEFDPATLARIADKVNGIDRVWLVAHSPIPADTRTPASFLACLYEPGEKVIVFDVFKSQGQAVWTCKELPSNPRQLDRFKRGKRNGVWFLSNPVDGTYKPNGAKNPDGTEKLSRRSWANVTAWRYMVLESDKADRTQWLAVLVQMPLRIAAIYSSGGKSIHALVRLDAGSKAEWDAKRDRMRPALVTLGADPKALSGVRLSRLPCCERMGRTDKEGVYHAYPAPRMQELLYLNPHPALAPLCELPVLHTPKVNALRLQSGEADL